MFMAWTQVFAPSLSGRAGGESSLLAQEIENGEAFYIYRNDGDFNGFFYDEVISMNYSKIDLEGVEHEEYVIQEIETADSLYRIPLAAIDSIGFQQPALKFNPKVRHMDLLGMTDYVKSVTGLALTFDPSMPAALKPQVGDMLLGFTGKLESSGFAGRVTNVFMHDGDIYVECVKPQKMSDIFDKFISIEQVGTDEATGQVKRRMAGYNQLRGIRRSSSDAFSTTLINVSQNFHIPFDSQAHISTTIDAAIGFKVHLAMLYQIDGDDYFAKASLSEDYSLDIGFTLKLSGSGDRTFPLLGGPLGSIKFPAVCPLFETNPFPGIGVRWYGELSAKVALPTKSGGMRQSFTINSRDPGLVSYNSSSYNNSNSVTSLFDESNVDFKLQGGIQGGLVWTLGVKTNQWFSNFFSATLAIDVWLGPKIEGTVNMSKEFFTEDDGPYSLRNSQISLIPLSIDTEAYAETYLWNAGGDKITFADGNVSLSRKDYYLFPSFEDFTASHDNENFMLTSNWKAKSDYMFWPSDVGMIMYHQEKAYGIEVSDATHIGFGDVSPDRFDFNVSTRSMRPGNYYVAPLLKAFGESYPIKSMKQRILVPVYLKVPKDTIKVSAAGETITIPTETNGNLNGSDVVTIPANKSIDSRTISHTITASVDDPDVPSVHTDVTIEQAGANLSSTKAVADIQTTWVGSHTSYNYFSNSLGDNTNEKDSVAASGIIGPNYLNLSLNDPKKTVSCVKNGNIISLEMNYNNSREPWETYRPFTETSLNETSIVGTQNEYTTLSLVIDMSQDPMRANGYFKNTYSYHASGSENKYSKNYVENTWYVYSMSQWVEDDNVTEEGTFICDVKYSKSESWEDTRWIAFEGIN